MAFDFTGLVNQNEFYPDHYWYTMLPDKVKDFERKWKSGEFEKDNIESRFLIFSDLKGQGKHYFRAKAEFTKASERQRTEIQRNWTARILQILGYRREPEQVELEPGILLPVLGRFEAFNKPYLWVIEAVNFKNAGDELLSLVPREGSESFRLLINKRFFGDSDHLNTPPRWILVTGLQTWVLLERDKWGADRMLRFNWDDLYNQLPRIETWKLLTMFLNKSVLCPDEGRSYQEELQEEATQHASGVSGTLKYALRESIEILGNEYVAYRRAKGSTWASIYQDAERLTMECLYYMYRLLFVFNVEARPELGYLPMVAKAYRNGYSLEKLRDLEMVSLDENGSAEGSFFHESLRILFDLIYEGYDETTGVQQDIHESGRRTFEIFPLQCELFDPAKTPLLNSITIPNRSWQRIIQMMSLGHEEFEKKQDKNKGRGRGRISYRHLSVNHLGAVYEALLSFHGFIAKEDLYEVKSAGESSDVLDAAYFVNREALEAHYDLEERVTNKDGTLRKYPRGTFIYRLTGRAREESASFYTPESLTQCITEFTLKEVLEGKSADEVLAITVCEPAMGSAAFLNEAVTQLAEAYLTRKTQELGEVLDADRRQKELQRVKMYLADNNVYGVDLNLVSVELGKISVWLNTLVPGGFVPWFGDQFKCGNSLVGAWRRVFKECQLTRGKWWEQTPEDMPLSKRRPTDTVYHFLLGDSGMAQYKDKVVKKLAGDQIKQIATWRTAFTKPLHEGEIHQLQYFSLLVDKLWNAHVRDLHQLESQTTDPFLVYPDTERDSGNVRRSSTRVKEKVYEKIMHPTDGNTSAYQRLKLVMDYWCAFWYWPVGKADLLPHRTEYLGDLAAILAGKQTAAAYDLLADRLERDSMGFVDIDSLVQSRPRLQLVRELSTRYRFHHWQLEYADQFKDRGGLDVVLGNPPWRKPVWVEKHVIGDTEPQFVTKKLSAAKTKELRGAWLDTPGHREHYIQVYGAVCGQLAFLNATQNYPLLKGMQTNLYKPFVCVSWAISRTGHGMSDGAVGLLHPNSVYDEVKGQGLRAALYPRLRWRLQFENVLHLFEEVHPQTKFSINVYGQSNGKIEFNCMANLYSPLTAKKSLKHDGFGPVPGIKTSDNKWELSGHQHRVIPTTETDLQTYADLYDDPGTVPQEARLPLIHARQLASILRKLAHIPRRMRDLAYAMTRMWDESGAQKDGTIRRETRFISDASEWILSGPHIFVGNPFFQTPNEVCKTNSDYTCLDLTVLPESYLPRTNYVRVCSESEYTNRTPQSCWGTLMTDEFRVAMRKRIGSSSERTLIPALLPPSAGHILTLQTVGARNSADLLHMFVNLLSIVTDMMVKISGKSDLLTDSFATFPLLSLPYTATARALGLSCLTQDYKNLWNEHVSWLKPSDNPENFASLNWSKRDHRLNPDWFDGLQRPWSRHSPLRTDYARRQALLEIDVLHAQELGLTLDELVTLYRIQFPILQSYENDTWYDAAGRIVFSKKTGQSPVPRTRSKKKTTFGIDTPKRSENNIPLGWNDVKNLKEGTITYTFQDDTMPGGPHERTIEFHAPFDKCDREEDYRQAWEYFEREKANGIL
ncbi:MAG: hypothetical protein OXI44_12525 [Bacteroidota bacterium]|nr:hypothetical protein [Bacteroidota bacterium]